MLKRGYGQLGLYVIASLLVISCQSNQKLEITRLDGSKIEFAELDSQINNLTSEAGVTGLAIAIFNNNQVAFQRAYGFANLENNDTLNTGHVFYGASFSKAVFGYLVAQLATEGIIDLDKPLQQYLEKPLPDYEFQKEWRGYTNLQNDLRYEKVTARMCLNHTAGFPNWRWMTKEFDFDPNGKIRFLIDPGSRYSYSGEGFNLLQFVIEKITNKSLEELMKERVFEPLKMEMTGYVWQERFEGKFCHGHSTNQEVIPKDKEDEANAAGSMETTIEDYSKFVRHILQSSEINSAVTNLLFEPTVRIRSKRQFGYLSWEDTDANDDISLSYGLGWGLLQTPHSFGTFKEGHGEGFQHYSIVFPEQDMGIIILTNSDNGESIFKYLLEISIGDVYTPWQWENYIPYDQ